MSTLGEGGWTAVGAVANVAMVLALVICLAEGATVTAWVLVPSLIALSGYAQWRADTLRQKEKDRHGH